MYRTIGLRGYIRHRTITLVRLFVSPIACYAWFPPFRCRSAVAVSPFPLRKFRKNYVSAVRLRCLHEKFRCAIAVATCYCAVTAIP